MPADTSLADLALRRLQEVFPAEWRSMVKLSPPITVAEPKPAAAPQVAVVESKRAAKPEAVASSRCSVRGCPFPAVVGTLCRGHVADSLAEKSLLPSTTA
jgi:hypothetical protein